MQLSSITNDSSLSLGILRLFKLSTPRRFSSEAHAEFTNSRRVFSESSISTRVVERRREPLCKGVHAGLALEF